MLVHLLNKDQSLPLLSPLVQKSAGKSKEDYVYEFDAADAQNLAMEFNSEMQRHPGLTNVIFKVDRFNRIVKSICFDKAW